MPPTSHQPASVDASMHYASSADTSLSLSASSGSQHTYPTSPDTSHELLALTTSWRSDTNVYIKGLPPSYNDEMLRDWAAVVAEPSSVKCITRHVHRSRSAPQGQVECTGVAFVRFPDTSSAQAFINLVNATGVFEACFAKETYLGKMEKASDPYSANLYLSRVPLDWTEEDVLALFPAPRYIVKSLRLLYEGDRPGKKAPFRTTPFKGAGFVRLATREMANMAIAELKGRPLSRKTDDHGGQPRGPGQSLQIRFADSEAQKFVKACDKNKSVKMLHQGTLHEAPHMRQMHSEPLRQTPFVPLSRDPSFASISSCGSESYLPSWHVNDLAHHHQPMPVPPFLSHNVPTGSTGLPSWPGSVFNLVGSHSLHPIAPSVISNSDSFEHLRNLHMSTPIPPAGHPCAQGRGLPGPSARVDQNLDPVHGMLYVKGSAPETSSSRATTRLQEANSGVVPSSSHTLVGPTFNALSTPHPNPGDWSHRYADDFHRDRCDTPLPAFDGKANETQPLSHEDTASFQLTQDDNLQQSVRQDNPLPHMHAHHEYHVPASTSTASGMYTIAEGIRISDSPMPKSANPSAGPLGEGLMQPSARIRAHTTAGEPLDERRAAYFDTGSRFGVETNEIPSGCALARRSSAVEARLMSSENPLLLPTPPTAKSELPAIPAMPSVVDVASILPLSPTSPTSPMQSQRRLPVLSPPSVKPGHRKTKSELRDLQPYFDNLSLASDMSRADELSATTYSPTTSQGMPSASASSFAASTRAVNQTQATEVDTHVCDPAIFRDDVCCSDAADVFDALAASLRAGPLGVDMNGSEDRPYNETGAANRQPYTTPMERPRSAWTHRKHGSLPSIPQYKHVVFNNPLSSDVKERESRGTVETIIQQTEHAQGLSRFDATYTFGTSYETRSSAKERQRPPFTRSDTRTFSPEQE